MVVPQSLQGEVYENVGDYFTYCISTETPKRLQSLRYKANSCQLKFKMRAIASFNKLAGFPKMSGYKQANAFGPSLLALNSQISAIIDRMTNTFEEFAETKAMVNRESPPSTYGLRKESLFIKMGEGSTRNDRLKVLNTILATNEEQIFLFLDVINYKIDQKERMKIIEYFNLTCAAICFLLGSFQLIQSVTANIKDSMWELGVLRSMGCTRI